MLFRVVSCRLYLLVAQVNKQCSRSASVVVVVYETSEDFCHSTETSRCFVQCLQPTSQEKERGMDDVLVLHVTEQPPRPAMNQTIIQQLEIVWRFYLQLLACDLDIHVSGPGYEPPACRF